MAPGKSVSKSARIAAPGIAAKGDLEIAARSLDEIRAALVRWADELTIDPENAHQSAVGVQAEAIRIAMSGLTVRAASERLRALGSWRQTPLARKAKCHERRRHWARAAVARGCSLGWGL
jgi:hypothetical protein